MNQKEIGKFIASIRKEKNMTQQKLGDLLGVTNKTVSRWENGTYMPDIAIIPELCSVLSIEVNELLSGKKLSEPEYHEYAEENLILSMKDAKTIRKGVRVSQALCSSATGALVAISFAPEGMRKNVMLYLCIVLLLISLMINCCFRKKIFGK